MGTESRYINASLNFLLYPHACYSTTYYNSNLMSRKEKITFSLVSRMDQFEGQFTLANSVRNFPLNKRISEDFQIKQ